MLTFTNSLKDALEKAQPYRKQTEISETANKALIVFIPGWAAKLTKYYHLLSNAIDRLDQRSNIEEISIWELLPFKYDNRFYSLEDPDKIARKLVKEIEDYFKYFGGNYNRIFLFGHSIGGLIARKGALRASEKDWFRKVNMILLASTNRGYSTDSLPIYQVILDKLTFDLPFLVKKSKRGSDCVNEIRLSWLRKFAEPSEENFDQRPIAPPTIQLIGNRDRVVKREDSLDIYRFTNTIEKVIDGITHTGFLENRESLDIVVNEIVEAFDQHLENNYSNTRNEIKDVYSEIESPDCVVFLVHGIRDFADWHEILEYEIHKKNPSAKVVSVRYGYFTALQFILPLQRSKNVRIFTDRYTQEFAKNPNIPIHIAAHSYGTFLVGRAMQLQPGIVVNRIYLAGSVLPRKFSWNEMRARLEVVRNDCANGDWPVSVLCRYLRILPWNRDWPIFNWYWGIGTAGIDGFLDSTDIVQSNKFIEGNHGSALEFPVTREITNFLLTEHLTDIQLSLNNPVNYQQAWQLRLYTLVFFFLLVFLIAVFTCIVIFIPLQWIAVTLSTFFTFIVIWFLLSV